jgi:hypothetical protein
MPLDVPDTEIERNEEPQGEAPAFTELSTSLKGGFATVLAKFAEDGPTYILYLLFVVLVSGLVAFFLPTHYGSTLGGARVVTFDVIKLGNAERAIASGIVGAHSQHGSNSEDNTLILTEASKRVSAAIQKEAGGALVFVKQAMVGPSSFPDITDAVLTDLDLPTTTPTVDSLGILNDIAPVTAGYSDAAYQVNASRQQNLASGIAAARAASTDATTQMVP